MADQNEVMQRREDVMTSLLRGRSTREIVQVVGSSYGVSKATIERDITYCYTDIRAKYERDIPTLISTHIGKYEEIHKAAMEMGDFRNAIAALQSIEKLLKLHTEQPLVAIQQNNLNLEGLSLQELLTLLNGSQ